MTTASTEAPAAVAPGRPRAGGLTWTSLLLSAGLLVGILAFADARQVFARLEHIDTRWLGAAFLLSLLQLAVLGARYAHIARTLGLPLSWLKATTEYALSVLVNQIFPTGIVGDGLRALRQAKQSNEADWAPAVEAVALDRLSGNVVLWLVVLATAPFGFGVAVFDIGRLGIALSIVGLVACVVTLVVVRVERFQRLRRGMARFVKHGARVLLAPKQALVHVPLSLALIGLILLQLYVSARAVGAELSPGELLWLGPLILLSTSLPSFFAGWGIREGAAALLFAAIGLPGSTGVAVALAFGVFSLIVALPGAVVLLFDSSRAVSSSTRWGQAHALSMATGLGLALWADFPPLLALVACLSFAILIVQLRAGWTPAGSFGVANSITSVRLLLTTLVLLGYQTLAGHWLAGIALSVLLLDATDGWWARKHGAASEFGALFDIEVDTVLVAGLTLVLFTRGQAGAWILLPPLLRYAYVLLPAFVTPLRTATARTRTGRFAYVFMIATFILGLCVPSTWSAPLTLLGTSLVTLSFLGSFWQSYAPVRVNGVE
ncbi:MAG TPA: lysylphosphatidylglycerol synthase domain-containing protein [Polyangiaceae bacterium]